MGKGGSERKQFMSTHDKGGTVMSEDASVNTGAVHLREVWPEPDQAWWAVRRMQTKLHCWAVDDVGRRFDVLRDGFAGGSHSTEG